MLQEPDPLLIQQTSLLLGLSADFVRKDYFVTQALQALTAVENDHFALIFQGGTSLSKAYRIIQRMSEDVDFRVIQKPAATKVGKEKKRKLLRSFRYDLIETLCNAGFEIPEQNIRVVYEGRFMSIKAIFPDSNEISYLNPHIAIDCFLGELALQPTSQQITTLIQRTLGGEHDVEYYPVSCVALDETAAEKWVALTRRVAATKIKPRDTDQHLVRHLYDLYHLNNAALLNGEFAAIAHKIIQKDRALFKKQNAAYADNPIETSKQALQLLADDDLWREHWNYFIEQMVYEQHKPSFDEAFSALQAMSSPIFAKLRSSGCAIFVPRIAVI